MKKIFYFFILLAGIVTSCGPGNQDNGPAHDRHTPSDSNLLKDTDPNNDPDSSDASGGLSRPQDMKSHG